MTFRAATPRGSRCEPVQALTTVQNDWRDVSGAADAPVVVGCIGA